MKKQDKFLELLGPVKENLERFCLGLARNREDAKDLFAETILLAYEALGTLENEKAFLSFLFSIASRTYSRGKKRQAKFIKYKPEQADRLFSYEIQPDGITDIQILHEAINKLPDKYREALILFEFHGFSQKEIAEINYTGVSNIKVRLFRAKKKLSKLLGANSAKRSINSRIFLL